MKNWTKIIGDGKWVDGNVFRVPLRPEIILMIIDVNKKWHLKDPCHTLLQHSALSTLNHFEVGHM